MVSPTPQAKAVEAKSLGEKLFEAVASTYGRPSELKWRKQPAQDQAQYEAAASAFAAILSASLSSQLVEREAEIVRFQRLLNEADDKFLNQQAKLVESEAREGALREALEGCLACWPHDFNSHGEELAEAAARAALTLQGRPG